nr:fe(2+) transport protein 2-like [Ipomoea trifida]
MDAVIELVVNKVASIVEENVIKDEVKEVLEELKSVNNTPLPSTNSKAPPMSSFTISLFPMKSDAMVDSFAMSFYKKHKLDSLARETVSQQQDSHHAAPIDGSGPTQLLRYRVVA